jgi:hypothetical protein
VVHVTHFIADALELLPQPAALFETKTLRFVAANAAASKFTRTQVGTEPVDVQDTLDKLGLSDVLAQADQWLSGTYTRHARLGWLHITRMPPQQNHPRPVLLLATFHPEGSEEEAWLDHNRMLLSVRINEVSETSVRSLETTLVQVSAALDATRLMLEDYNSRMGDFLRRPKKM